MFEKLKVSQWIRNVTLTLYTNHPTVWMDSLVVMCKITVRGFPAYSLTAGSGTNWCFWVFLSIKCSPGLMKAISQNSGQILRVGKSIEILPPASIFGYSAWKLFSQEPSKWRLCSEGCIDSSSKLTPRSGFECARLTLLWSQSTTGNYFEERRALSVRFHNQNGGRRAPVTDEWVYVKLHMCNMSAAQ